MESRDEVLLLLLRSGNCGWRGGRAEVSREVVGNLGCEMGTGGPEIGRPTILENIEGQGILVEIGDGKSPAGEGNQSLWTVEREGPEDLQLVW